MRLAVLVLHGPQLGRRWRSSISSLRHHQYHTLISSHSLLSANLIRIGQQRSFSTVRHYKPKPTRRKQLEQGCPVVTLKYEYKNAQCLYTCKSLCSKFLEISESDLPLRVELLRLSCTYSARVWVQ